MLERDGRGLNLTAEVRDGILNHTGPNEPDTLEGKIVRLVDRVAYINHDIDDAVRAGVLDPAELPRAEIELLGPTGSRRIDALVHDLVETSAREGDIRQSEEVGAAMLALRSFMFERVYLGEPARAEHARARATVQRIFDHLLERGDPVDDVIDYVAGMTDRFALSYAETPLMARIKDASVREAVEAARHGRGRLRRERSCAAPARAAPGCCPFHEEKTPSFSVNPPDKLFYCFGCGKGGDVITFVRETEQLDFVAGGRVAGRPLPRDARVRGDLAGAGRASAAGASGCSRCSSRRRAFYERYLWDSPRGEAARAYLESRGLGEEVCREYRLGLAPGGATLARKAREKGFTAQELRAAGLVNRRGNDYFNGRLLFPLADARGRVRGFQARKLREDDPLRAKYVNSPEGELFRKGDLLYGLDRARTAIAKQERAVVVEGNTDVLALHQAGLEPVVASMGTALTERQLKELSRLTHKACLCFDGDAAGEAATLRGMELAAAQGFDVRVVTLPPGPRPGRRSPAGSTSCSAGAESYLAYRVRLEIERAPDRQEAFVRVREVLSRFEDSPERQDAVRLAADRLDLPKETQAGFAPGRGGRATGEISPRLLEKGSRLERDALAGVAAHPRAARAAGRARARALRRRAAPARPGAPARARRAGRRSSCRCWPSSTRARRPRGSTRRRPRSCCCACASASSAASSRRPTSSARRSSRSSSRRSARRPRTWRSRRYNPAR